MNPTRAQQLAMHLPGIATHFAKRVGSDRHGYVLTTVCGTSSSDITREPGMVTCKRCWRTRAMRELDACMTCGGDEVVPCCVCSRCGGHDEMVPCPDCQESQVDEAARRGRDLERARIVAMLRAQAADHQVKVETEFRDRWVRQHAAARDALDSMADRIEGGDDE